MIWRLLNKYWSFRELESFTCNVFLRSKVLFIFCLLCCLLYKSFGIAPHSTESKKPWLTDQVFEYQTLWLVTVSFRLSRTNSWQTSVVVFLKVSIMYPIKAQLSLKAFDLFKIVDLNWQVTMYCDVPLRLCVQEIVSFYTHFTANLRLFLILKEINFFQLTQLFLEKSNFVPIWKFIRILRQVCYNNFQIQNRAI